MFEWTPIFSSSLLFLFFFFFQGTTQEFLRAVKFSSSLSIWSSMQIGKREKRSATFFLFYLPFLFFVEVETVKEFRVPKCQQRCECLRVTEPSIDRNSIFLGPSGEAGGKGKRIIQ